jgi:hypothetical protein
MPIEANASEVRSHAKNVRSVPRLNQYLMRLAEVEKEREETYQVPNDLLPHYLYFPVRWTRSFPLVSSTRIDGHLYLILLVQAADGALVLVAF